MIDAKMSKRDEARFRKAIQKLVALSGEPVEDILRTQGRLFAVDAAKFTSPFGDKKADGDNTKRKVEKTIFSTYKRAGDLKIAIGRKAGEKAAARFAKYIRRGDFSQAKQLSSAILGGAHELGPFDGGRMHKRRLSGKSWSKLYITKGFPAVNQYARATMRRVGEGKSGWAKAAAQLGGTRGIPAWAKKKTHRTKGLGIVEGKNSKASVTVTNRSKYVFKTTSTKYLWRLRLGKVEKLVERMIKNRARKRIKRT